MAAALALLPGCAPLSAAPPPTTIALHVAPDGDDAAPGTAVAPLATVHRAVAVLRDRLADDRNRDVMIALHAGTHRIEEPIRIGPAHLPRAGRGFTIAGHDGARPVISGGRVITGWSLEADGTLRTVLPEVAAGAWRFRELFVDGERRPRARHPDAGFARIEQTLPDRRSGFIFRPGDVPPGVGPGAELVFMHDWSTSRVRIESVDEARRRLVTAQTVGPRADHYRIDNFEPHPRYFIENDASLLDAAGEWHLDETSGVLRYRPHPGETPATIQAVAPRAGALLVVRGSRERPARRLEIRGVSFEHAAWPLPPGGYAAGQATMHEQRDDRPGPWPRRLMPAAIAFELAEDCALIDCRVARVGMTGIWIGSRTTSCAIRGCVIEDVAGNGINLGEDASRQVDGEPWWSAAPEQAAAHHHVSDSLIQTCGQQLHGAVGIWIGLARHVRIEHNEIRDLPYTGVSVGWMWNSTPTPVRANAIERNHIHRVMQVLSDGGGIYTLGLQPGTSLSYNHIHAVPANAGRAESNGMFIDQGTDRLVIAGNVIHAVERSPLRFHQALHNLVRDNVLVVAEAGTPPIRYNATDPATIVQQDNLVMEAAGFDRQAVRAVIRTAGPRPPWRERLGL
jgi:hypothetical protein